MGEIRETKTLFSVCGIDLGRRDFMGGGCGLELLRFYGDLEILFLVLLLFHFVDNFSRSLMRRMTRSEIDRLTVARR